MEPEEIDNIATTMVDQEVLEKSPVCLDTFQLREEVNILGCGHLYHAYCIKHWMGMHASCPVCRRGEGDREGGEDWGEEEQAEGDTVMKEDGEEKK